MGTISIWHWLIVLLVFGVPVAAVATERSGRTIPRGSYALWLLGLVAYGPVMRAVAWSGGLAGSEMGTFALIFLLGLLVLLFFYNRAVVRRLRDAGHEKRLAYAGVVPFLNVLLAVYLLVKPGATGRS